ncbi:hypothetical protein BD310DRAFT_980497 [Dichomitus squalens]|uniref:Uncharacterized protein n=1 Tax=Dichomitus squalens TaxID=114155 RepID=A0A4Q9PJJ3_9APHY|nr:hypothetical protein BD310DRAFT_980497 [Dichomitus squalens]
MSARCCATARRSPGSRPRTPRRTAPPAAPPPSLPTRPHAKPGADHGAHDAAPPRDGVGPQDTQAAQREVRRERLRDVRAREQGANVADSYVRSSCALALADSSVPPPGSEHAKDSRRRQAAVACVSVGMWKGGAAWDARQVADVGGAGRRRRRGLERGRGP